MIRITSEKPVGDVLAVIRNLGANFHLGRSRSLVIMTPEDFARCIEAAREGATQAVVDFFNDKSKGAIL